MVMERQNSVKRQLFLKCNINRVMLNRASDILFTGFPKPPFPEVSGNLHAYKEINVVTGCGLYTVGELYSPTFLPVVYEV